MLPRLSEYEASGMTVNERLFALELMDAFDRAIANGNRAEMVRIFEQVYLTPDEADYEGRGCMHCEKRQANIARLK
jgi:hypothetical protein